MKPDAVVRALEEAVTQLGVRVRYERGAFRGGRCVVDDEEQVVLNRRLPVETHLDVLASCLRELPHEAVYLRPAVRAALEDAWARQARGQVDQPELEE
ncbi:MAG: hypothetical protein AAGF99_09755 [Bacteroidota bacterium]